MSKVFLFFHALCGVATAWNLVHLERYTAVTTIRLWHELHVARNVPHDFISLLSSEDKTFFVGIVRHEELRAIARCTHDNAGCTRSVTGVATSPNHMHAGTVLLSKLSEKPYNIDWKAMREQPRWFYETLYIHKKLFESDESL